MISKNMHLCSTIELRYTVGLNEKEWQVNIKPVNIRPCLQQYPILANI